MSPGIARKKPGGVGSAPGPAGIKAASRLRPWSRRLGHRLITTGRMPQMIVKENLLEAGRRRLRSSAHRRLMAGIVGAAIGLTGLAGVFAQVISDPTGHNLFAIGTSGESVSAQYLAVSNGGNASNPCTWNGENPYFGCGVAASNGGNATGQYLAISNGGAATSTCYVWLQVGCGMALSVGGPSWGAIAASLGGPSGAWDLAISVLGPSAWSIVAVELNPLGDAFGCGTVAVPVVSVTGTATNCNGAAVGSAAWSGGPNSCCGLVPATAIGVGPAYAYCTEAAIAVALMGSASASCPIDVGSSPMNELALAISVLGPAWTCDSSYSLAISLLSSATACPNSTNGAFNWGVALSPINDATGGEPAISILGAANSGAKSISGTGPANACGNPSYGNQAVSVTGTATACHSTSTVPDVAVGGRGASGGVVSVSPAGNASGYIAVSGTGNAYGQEGALSLAGHYAGACNGPVPVAIAVLGGSGC